MKSPTALALLCALAAVAAAAVCGNGVLEGDEQCDDGLYKVDMLVPATDATAWYMNDNAEPTDLVMHLQLDLQINHTLVDPINSPYSFGTAFVRGLVVNTTDSSAPFSAFSIEPNFYETYCENLPIGEGFGSQVVIYTGLEFTPPGISYAYITFQWLGTDGCAEISTASIYDTWSFYNINMLYTDAAGNAYWYWSSDAGDAVLPLTRGTLCCSVDCEVPSPLPMQECINETQAITPVPGPQFCSSNGVCTWDWASASLTGTLTPSSTPSNTPSQTQSPSNTPTRSQSSTPTKTPPVTQSRSQSMAPTPAATKAAGASPSETPSNSKTGTGTRTNTPSNTQTRTPSPTSSQTPTLPSPSSSPVPPASHSVTQTSTQTRTPTPSGP